MQTPVIKAIDYAQRITCQQQQQRMPGAVEQQRCDHSPGFATRRPGRENMATAANAARRVINSHRQRVKIAAAKMGHMFRIHRRRPGQKNWTSAGNKPQQRERLPEIACISWASVGSSLFGTDTGEPPAQSAVATGTAQNARNRTLAAATLRAGSAVAAPALSLLAERRLTWCWPGCSMTCRRIQ